MEGKELNWCRQIDTKRNLQNGSPILHCLWVSPTCLWWHPSPGTGHSESVSQTQARGDALGRIAFIHRCLQHTLQKHPSTHFKQQQSNLQQAHTPRALEVTVQLHVCVWGGVSENHLIVVTKGQASENNYTGKSAPNLHPAYLHVQQFTFTMQAQV